MTSRVGPWPGHLWVVVIALLVIAPAVALAGEPVRRVGPVSGSEYEIAHSCLADAVNAIRRDRSSGVVIDFERSAFDEAGRFSGGSVGLFSTSPDSLSTSRRSGLPRRGSYVVSERMAGEGDFVEVVRTSWDCPDYHDLPASVFVPITPERVLDTRRGSAINFSGPKPPAATQIEITTAMMPSLPDDVVAISANVGIVESAGGGFAQFLPTGHAPGTSSSVNTSGPGENVVNLAVSPTGGGGSVSVYTSASAHLTVDINGYFVASDGPERSGRAVTIAPDRVLDTRNGSPGEVPGGAITTVDLSADSALPAAQASAAIVNVTVVKTSPLGGFVQGAATGSLVPGRSALLNTGGGDDTVAALAVLPVSNGSIDLYTSNDAAIIVDVLGWFTNDVAPRSATGRFTPLEPERLFDSRVSSAVNYVGAEFASTGDDQFAADFRTGARRPDTITDIEMRGIEGIESSQRPAASSIFANIVFVDASGGGFLQAGARDEVTVGASSNVNAAAAGQTNANAAIVTFPDTDSTRAIPALYDGISVYTSSGGQIVVDVVGFFTR